MAKVRVTIEIEERAVARYWDCDGPEDLYDVNASARDMVRGIINGSEELNPQDWDILTSAV